MKKIIFGFIMICMVGYGCYPDISIDKEYEIFKRDINTNNTYTYLLKRDESDDYLKITTYELFNIGDTFKIKPILIKKKEIK